MSEFKVLIAVDQQDAEKYIEHFQMLKDAKVTYLEPRPVAEGLRCTEAYTTPMARGHENYLRVWRALYNSRVLMKPKTPPRVL